MAESLPSIRLRPLVVAAEGTIMNQVADVLLQLSDDPDVSVGDDPAVPVARTGDDSTVSFVRTVDEARRFVEREGYRVNTILLHPPAHDTADLVPFITDVRDKFPWIRFVHCTTRRS